MSLKNYKSHLKTLSKKELIALIDVPPLLAEKYEVESVGGTHNTAVNGADGFGPDGEHIEIKAQVWSGTYQLRGRGKFGGCSQKVLDAKSASNERVIFVGYDAHTGDVYYRFSVMFEDIAGFYKQKLAKMSDKDYSNIDVCFIHYFNEPSFEILYIADKKTLAKNKHKLQTKFYNALINL